MTSEQADIILERLTQGESLLSICRSDPSLPAESSVRHFALVDEPKGFTANYARARDIGIDARMERVLDKAATLKDELHEGSHPQLVAAARLAWDAERWHASKCAPKKYGDRLELAGDPKAPLEYRVIRSDREEPKP